MLPTLAGRLVRMCGPHLVRVVFTYATHGIVSFIKRAHKRHGAYLGTH